MSKIKTKLANVITRRRVQDATRVLNISITNDDVKNGIPGDSDKCVFACSLRAHFGDTIENAAVGSRVTKIYTPGMVTRYATPSTFREAILTFDKTGKWILPTGVHVLGVLARTQRLGGQKNKVKETRPRAVRVFKGRAISLPTRTSNFESALV